MIYLAGFLAYFIKGLCGFANTLVFQSVLRISDASLNMNITPLECLLSWPFNLLMTWHKRAYLKLKRVAGLIVLVLGGAVIGVFLLKNLHGAWLNRLFGITVIAIALDLLFLKKKSDPDPLESVTDPKARRKIIDAFRATEMYMFASNVAIGLLMMISVLFDIDPSELRWQRTPAKEKPSEENMVLLLRNRLFMCLLNSSSNHITDLIRSMSDSKYSFGSDNSV